MTGSGPGTMALTMDEAARGAEPHPTQYADARNLRARQALHERYGTGGGNWFQWIFRHLPELAAARVLELGAGPGRLWVENADRIPEGWSVVVSDLSDGMRAEAEASLGRRPGFSFPCVDAQDIPFAEDAFDAVVANHMLYHVPDLDRALREVRRVLRPGGVFLAATNGADHMKELDEIARTALPVTLAVLAQRRDELAGFRLENGGDILRRWFDRVERHDAGHPLVVPDAEPLVAYLASVGGLHETLRERAPDERQRLLEDATRRVAERIARLGPLRITRATGLFVAR